MDTFIEFLVGRSSLQIHFNLSIFCLVDMVFSHNLDFSNNFLIAS